MLGDNERQNRCFIDFFGDFSLRHTFQQPIAPKSLEIDQENLRIKFSTLNVVFTCLNLSSLRSKSPLYGGVKFRYSFKMCAFGRSNGSSYARPVAPFGVCK